ncbi:MAG: hypothetical protein U0168_19865, partial [Nannocystaceae bacterium]
MLDGALGEDDGGLAPRRFLVGAKSPRAPDVLGCRRIIPPEPVEHRECLRVRALCRASNPCTTLLGQRPRCDIEVSPRLLERSYDGVQRCPHAGSERRHGFS